MFFVLQGKQKWKNKRNKNEKTSISFPRPNEAKQTEAKQIHFFFFSSLFCFDESWKFLKKLKTFWDILLSYKKDWSFKKNFQIKMSTCPGICLGRMVFTPTALFYIRACHKCLNLTPSKLTGLSLLCNIDPDNTWQSYRLPTLLYNKGYSVGLGKYLLFFIPS